MNSNHYDAASSSYSHLSLRDLLDARDQYHIFLMRHPNVVATAIGPYRIRQKDSWPSKSGKGKVHGAYARTLENSEVRDYSWPSILVFVEKWITSAELAKQEAAAIPKTLYLRDGRSVPVCVIEAPKESLVDVEARDIRYPINNMGGGSAIVARVQAQEYAATVACLVSDGHKVYALTNRHVTGEPGEVVYSRLDGKIARIGASAGKQLTREAFGDVYPGWPGSDLFVNLDVGLIDVDDINRWTTEIRDIPNIGPMMDVSVSSISLSMVGSQVRGFGAASGIMLGEIHALFYRYKTGGGFEYVADVLIGPRTRSTNESKGSRKSAFVTHPGDSGTLWLLDPPAQIRKIPRKRGVPVESPEHRPLAMQWGRNMLHSAGPARIQSFALGTFLSRVCAQLEVDPVRAWNIDQPDTWGSIGHFSIATRTSVALSDRFPKLVSLMKNNAAIISHDADTIRDGDFVGLGQKAFVPMADVPDFFWKPRISKQGFARPFEGPNHFADMDQPDAKGATLLSLSKNDSNINPSTWNRFYDSVKDLLSGEPITPLHRGLLPFRVWQIFDEMVEFARKGNPAEFVCAAGVLTHYLGDACQPLHISYLHDGDPERSVTYTFKKGKKEGQTEERALGQGVHSAYEDEMVGANRDAILKGLLHTPRTRKEELVANGFQAAKATIALMRETFEDIPPIKIVNAFIGHDGGGAKRAKYMWDLFGADTIRVMQGGAHLLAVLWESAWNQGEGERHAKSTASLSEKAAMRLCQDPDFLPSVTVDKIGSLLVVPKTPRENSRISGAPLVEASVVG